MPRATTKRPRGRPKKHLAPRHTLPLRLDATLYRELRQHALDTERPLHDLLVEVIAHWWATQPKRPSG